MKNGLELKQCADGKSQPCFTSKGCQGIKDWGFKKLGTIRFCPAK